MDFNILLVSLIPKDDELFTKNDKNIKDIKLFEQALDFSEERADGYSIKVRIYDQEAGVMAGIISKKSKISLHDKDFQLHEEEDYPPVIWFWDRKEQCILIEKRSKVFSSPEVSAKAFSNISNNILLAEYGLRAHIQPKSVNREFWESINSFSHVYQVQFKLTAPNMFGNTKKEMGEFLHEVVDETNATEFAPTFLSKDGNLSLKSSKWLNAIIDWVSEGAGSWLVKGKNDKDERLKTIESVQKARIVTVKGDITELELENYSSRDIIQIIDLLREKYTYRK